MIWIEPLWIEMHYIIPDPPNIFQGLYEHYAINIKI